MEFDDDDNQVERLLDFEGKNTKFVNTDNLKTPTAESFTPSIQQDDLLEDILLSSDHDDEDDEEESNEQVVAVGSDEFIRLQYKENDPELTKYNF